MSVSIGRVGLLVLILLSACSSPHTEIPAEKPVNSLLFEQQTCWGTVPPGAAATCGFVKVPQNRSKPPGENNTIRLAVMVIRAPGVHYSQPPTFLLGGGPGQDVIALYDSLFQEYQALLKNGFPAEQYPGHLQDMQQFKAVMDLFTADLQKREFVVFDQRGAGYSQPSLKCHGEDWDVCRNRLLSLGADIPAYNTIENADDINDIRLTLGYEQINLQGGSYGTRLALETIRRHPQILRAVVLDSVAPPQIDWAVEMVKRYENALDVLFDHCRADPLCQAAYPALENDFYDLIPKLNMQPVELQAGDTTVRLNGNDLLHTVWNALYDSNKIRFLPLLIKRVNERNTDIWEKITPPGLAPDSGETIAWGMHFAAECAERWSFEQRQDLVSASVALRPELRAAAVDAFDDSFQTCAIWDVPAAPSSIHTPVQSDISTLLLSGEFDPGTPPAFAQITAETLSHSYTVVFPYLGHTDGFTSSCHARVISQFLDDPDNPPDTRCVAEMDKSPFFVE